MVKVIGNRLNSANKKVLDRMNKMDFEFIRRETLFQVNQGAEFVEINAVSLLHNEINFIKQAIPMIENSNAKVMVISENIDVLHEAIKTSKKEIIIGAIEFDIGKIDAIIDSVREKDVKIIALITEKINNKYDGYSPEGSLYIAQKYIDYLLDNDIKRENILLDPVVRPLEDDFSNGKIFLNTLELFKLDFPQVKTMANISNLSEGLPKRNLLASYFVSLALSKGLDYIVTNVLDDCINESIVTTMSIIGKDKNLKSYLEYWRNTRKCKGRESGRPKNKRNID